MKWTFGPFKTSSARVIASTDSPNSTHTVNSQRFHPYWITTSLDTADLSKIVFMNSSVDE